MSTFSKMSTALVVTFALAGPAFSAIDRNDPAYQDCLAQVETNPQAAFNMAEAWKKQTGSDGADHCKALALIGLKAVKEGARDLGRLSDNAEIGDANLRAEIYLQAAEAWATLNETEQAHASLEAAKGLAPNKAWVKTSILIAEAEVDLTTFDYAAAETHLTQALEILPNHLDALITRAGVRRHLEDPVGALADLQYVLTEDAENPEALLERGLLKKDYFDPDGARADLEHVVELAPGTATAAKAQNTLNVLDLRNAE